jgi:transposase
MQISERAAIGVKAATLVERIMREGPHPEQGYCSAMRIIALARRYERDRLEAACERALAINANQLLIRERHPQIRVRPREPAVEPVKATPTSSHPYPIPAKRCPA